MLVKCKEEYEEVKSGDVGKVIKVGVASLWAWFQFECGLMRCVCCTGEPFYWDTR